MQAAQLAVVLWAPGVPPHASLLLAPQDWGVRVVGNPRAAATSVLLTTGSLNSCMSAPAIRALTDLAAALHPGSSSASASSPNNASDIAALASNAESPAADATSGLSGKGADDLACGLFSLSADLSGPPGGLPEKLHAQADREIASKSSRHIILYMIQLMYRQAVIVAGVLQISLGDDASGKAPWDGSGDSWVAWRYPYPRAVQRLELRDVPAELAEADFELACQPRGSDELHAAPLRRRDRAFSPHARHILLETTVQPPPSLHLVLTPKLPGCQRDH